MYRFDWTNFKVVDCIDDERLLENYLPILPSEGKDYKVTLIKADDDTA